VKIFIEQGVEGVEVELMDAYTRKVLAVKSLDVMKDVLEPKARGEETLYQMKQKSKTTLNPKIRLTILLDSDNEMEQGLLASMDVSPEAGVVLRQQLHQADLEKGSAPTADSKLEGGGGGFTQTQLLLKCCTGPLEKFGSWGSRSPVFMAAQGPPERRKYTIGLWQSQAHYESGQRADEDIDVMKITSVVPDPHPKRQEVFILQYVDVEHRRQRLTFRRLDRARDVWVEMLHCLIKMLHDMKDEDRRKSTAQGQRHTMSEKGSGGSGRRSTTARGDRSERSRSTAGHRATRF
jgi:hypothetical protein